MGGVLNLFNSWFNRLGQVGAVACCRQHPWSIGHRAWEQAARSEILDWPRYCGHCGLHLDETILDLKGIDWT